MNALFTSASPVASVAPDKLAAIRARFLASWLHTLEQSRNGTLAAPSDRRFSDAAWSENPAYLSAAHLYLLTGQALNELVDEADLDPDVRARVRFTVMQWIDAASPANFLLTNPQAQKKALETNGQSLMQGLQLLVTDLQKGRLSQTDESAFEVGVNVAVTPGAVVYENPLMQLIQYAPQSRTVHEKPLLIVPPCINKFYILDLQESNSFVRYAVEQGFTVFLVSWRNPLPGDTDSIHKATWGDYLQHGILQAVDVVRQIGGQTQINALGFCVGGTMLASALALARSRGQQPVSALTLLTSFLNFQNTGVLDVFVDDIHARIRDQQLGQGGLMTARELACTFSFLRPAELVWHFVTNNYLMGVAPPAFDLLYWNADGTNLPGPFFAWYFRNAYLENNLVKPGRVRIDGYPVDLASLDMPAYIYASREDHIVPWESAYASTHILEGQHRFVLGASGHIAGVINHPSRKRRSYWAHGTNGSTTRAASPQEWLAAATEHAGSWWPDWAEWLAQHSGARVAPPAAPGNEKFVPIEAAPGRYVRVRAV